MNRAYSLLTVKAVDEDQRILEGIATTPAPDRLGDIVEPKGAEFTLPLPLLWQHDSGQPIGHVTKAVVTKDGITVTAKLAKVDEPGVLRDRLDEAWQSLKAGLVRGLSIGFKAIESAKIEGTWSYRFVKWSWLELSAVTIPANQEATIQTLKSIDHSLRGAPARELPVVVRLTPPAPGKSQQPKSPMEGKDMKTVSEQIEALVTKRTATAVAMQELTTKSIEAGETMNAEDQQKFDDMEREIEAIDGQIKRLKSMESILAAGAKAVGTRAVEPAPAPTPGVSVNVKQPPKPEPGIRFARYVRCMGIAHKDHIDAVKLAEALYGERDPVVVGMVKAAGSAVGAYNTTTDAALIGNEGGFADFVELLRNRSIVGRFGNGGIPALRGIPFRVPLITQATSGGAYWVGEGDGKPVVKGTFTRTELAPLKIAAISVATMEVLRDSSPGAERLIRDDLAASIVERMDLSFIDPTNAGSNGVYPASITYGAESIAATGTGDADDIRLDVRAVMQKFIDAKNPLTTGVWVMSASNALALSMLKNTLGQAEFPAITINGGMFEGLPVIVSDHIGSYVALVNASDIWFGDEGGIQIDMSDQASLQMVGGDDEGSTQNSITPTATSVVSLWQTNSVGIRAERTLNWLRRRTSAVAYISGAQWGGHVPPS